MANAKTKAKSKKRAAIKDLRPKKAGTVKGGDTASGRADLSSFTITKVLDKTTPLL